MLLFAILLPFWTSFLLRVYAWMGLLADQGAGAGGEIQLTDSMARLMEMQRFFAYEFEGAPYDCGSKLGYFGAVLAHALDHPEISTGVRELISKL